MKSKTTLGITVVVCTYNGENLLYETIRHIAEQQVHPKIDWEVLVIDNASTDNSSRIAQEAWESCNKYNQPVPFHILSQPKQGLTHARELALIKAKYEFIIFCDDDNWLNPSYITTAFNLMTLHGSVGALGGYGELLFETPAPGWAFGHGLFANGPQAIKPGKVKNNMLYGAGFVIRKSAYEKVIKSGFKPILTDRKGTQLSSGGDYEICFALAMQGYDIWYDDRLKFKHFIPNQRMTWSYYLRFMKEGAHSFEVLIPYRILVNNGSRTALQFHLYYSKVILSYIVKYLNVYLKKLKGSNSLDEAMYYSLKLISLKSKIKTANRYTDIKKNYNKILKFENEKINIKSSSTSYTPKQPQLIKEPIL